MVNAFLGGVFYCGGGGGDSRLYNESKHLHAPHDADILKKIDADADAQTGLPNRVMIRLQAGAYLSLCRHLRARSDSVQNMELMSISGFCRNCLAKVWLSTYIFAWDEMHLSHAMLYLYPFSGLLLKHEIFQTR